MKKKFELTKTQQDIIKLLEKFGFSSEYGDEDSCSMSIESYDDYDHYDYFIINVDLLDSYRDLFIKIKDHYFKLGDEYRNKKVKLSLGLE